MDSRYIETHKTWDEIAQLYEDHFMALDLYNDTYKTFCDLISKPNGRVLEIGCGPGNITRQIVDINPNLKVLATDVSKNMIELAKKNNPGIETKVLDCRNINHIQGTFIGIICGFTIPYLTKPDCVKLIFNCSNLLMEEGVLYLSFVSGDYKNSRFLLGSTGLRTFFHFHELDFILQELASNRLSVLHSIQKEYKKSNTSSETHTILILKKNGALTKG